MNQFNICARLVNLFNSKGRLLLKQTLRDLKLKSYTCWTA